MQLQQEVPLPGPIPAEVIRVIDGDTIEVRAHIWPGHSVETRVRVAGIDTPELRRPDCEEERRLAYQARDHVIGLLPEGAPITLHEIKLGSFAGRVVADIAIEGERLSGHLLSLGLAQPYGESDFCP